MECEQVRDRLVTFLPVGQKARWPEPVFRHLEDCASCRAERESLSRTWALLGRLPEAAPRKEVERRLMRRIRLEVLKESVLTVQGWAPAALASVIGVGLSIGLSLVIPYALLVSLCRRVIQGSGPYGLPYLVAGMAYGVPLAMAVWLIRRRMQGGLVIRSVEASGLFLVMLMPYVILRCREFTPADLVTFASGLAGAAVGSTLAAFWLIERGRAPQVQP